MIKLKKICLSLLTIMIIFSFNSQYARWLPTRDHYQNTYSQSALRPSDWTIDGTPISSSDPIWWWTKYMGEKSVWIINLPQVSDYDSELWYTLALIQILVNWTLWMIAFVALIYMIYNWFLFISSGSDSKRASKWKKWIGTAAIAIAWIAISWLIISIMIWLITGLTTK